MNSKFSKITQIYQNLYEKIQTISMNDEQMKKHEIEQHATDMLEHENYDTYFKIVKNGYQPNNIQEKMLEEAFLNNPYTLVGEHGYCPDGKTLAKFLLSSGYLSSNYHILATNQNPYIATGEESNSKLLEYIVESLKKPEMQKTIYDVWEKTVTSSNQSELATLSYDGAAKAFLLLKDVWFTDKNLSDYKNIIKAVDRNCQVMQKKYEGAMIYSTTSTVSQRVRSCLLSLSENMSANMSEVFSKNTEQVLHQTKQLYINDVVDNIVFQSQYEKTKTYHIKNLPDEAQDIIMQIEKKYTRLSIMMESLAIDEKVTATKLMKERLPEVVRKYFSIDEDYRTTLKNHEGKYPKELLVDSLKQIHDIFQHIVQKANEDKVNNLTVDNRYMHAVKKDF